MNKKLNRALKQVIIWSVMMGKNKWQHKCKLIIIKLNLS